MLIRKLILIGLFVTLNNDIFAADMRGTLDLDKLSESIQKAEKQVVKQIEKQIEINPNITRVLVVGVTGSGKSTLVHALAGRKLVANDDSDCWSIDLREGETRLPGFTIGHGLDSATNIPNSWHDKEHNLSYWDCPGFLDSRGEEQEIVNAFAIDQIFSPPSRVKIILAMQDYEFKGARGRDALQRLIKIISLIPNLKDLQSALSLVVTKTPLSDRFPAERKVSGLLEKIKEANDIEQTDKQKLISLLEFIKSKNKIFSFPEPDQAGEYNLFKDRNALIESLKREPAIDPKHAMTFEPNVFWCIATMVQQFADVPGLIFELGTFCHTDYRHRELSELEEWVNFTNSLLKILPQIKNPQQLVKEIKKSIPAFVCDNKNLNTLIETILTTQRYLDFVHRIDGGRGLIPIGSTDIFSALGPLLKDMDAELRSLIENKKFLMHQQKAQQDLEKRLDDEVKAGKLAQNEATRQIKEMQEKTDKEREKASSQLASLQTQLDKTRQEASEQLEKALEAQQKKYATQMDELKTKINEAEERAREAQRRSENTRVSRSEGGDDIFMRMMLLSLMNNGGGVSQSHLGGGYGMPSYNPMPTYSMGGMDYSMPFQPSGGRASSHQSYSSSSSSSGRVWVRPYTKANGVEVKGHYRSSPRKK